MNPRINWFAISAIKPLWNPYIIKQDTVSMGMKPIALPLSESAKRQMLESNQRVINDVAERSLKLVLSTRIELVMAGYQPTVIPFNYKRIYGGSGEIRTHGPIAEPTVFKTVAINRTLPRFPMLVYLRFAP